MTEENYQYRTSQQLLRNQFPGKGKWEIPVIPKAEFSKDDFQDLLLIGMELLGHDGNIFSIMGRASHLLKQAGMRAEANEIFNRVTGSGSYDVALQIISEYVETETSHTVKV